MDRIRITGGQRLHGTIPISGAKNAALPLMIASLLTPDTVTLKNVPNLADVSLLIRILRNHGVDTAFDGKRANGHAHQGETLHLTARDIVDTVAPYDMVRRMRASFWVLGPLLAARTRPASRCRAAAPSARGPSICTSWGFRRSGPRSASTAAMSSRRRRGGCKRRDGQVPESVRGRDA